VWESSVSTVKGRWVPGTEQGGEGSTCAMGTEFSIERQEGPGDGWADGSTAGLYSQAAEA
jgi:hypothetical protein